MPNFIEKNAKNYIQPEIIIR